MSDLVRKVLAAGGAVLYTIMPAKGVSANEVAKEFSKGKTPVVVVEDKEGIGRTVGKGRFSIGLEGGYESIDTEVTKGKATQQSPDGVPEAPFPPTEPVTTTIPIDPDATNRAYDFQTRRAMAHVVGSYGITDWLEIFGKVGGAQSDFNAKGKTGLANFSSDSKMDLTYWAGVRAVPVQFKGGLYVALESSYRGGSHKDMSIDTNPQAKVDVDWRDFSGLIEIGKRFGGITPYGGVKYSDYKETRDARDPTGRSRFDFEGKNPWSGFAGIEGKLTKNLSVGANATFGEGRQAYFISFQKRF